MNEFQIGTEAVADGHLGWIRKVHRATKEIVRDSRGEPIVFATQDAAKAAAGEAMVAYLNTPMAREWRQFPKRKLSSSPDRPTPYRLLATWRDPHAAVEQA